ncbi:type I phosphomannose isomerase catalytic subunit [Mesomycoplasma molare]|uniref:Phosphohexomutase n=1 Tax=Mesomycoplasma molare TaxID=171288 RepID=A0ABY5TXW5_9BACT|nr:type I phosphomannose isomerase catalytic subunit [Mesomycoplasma molare]UWD34356.1 mannose-6-phosphate isomerase [Mesomycoplasma molare]
MNKNIIFLKPYFKKVIWANTNLKKLYNLNEDIGEAWLISAIENCESTIVESGEKFSDFIKKNPEFFNLTKESVKNFIYPNLTKFLDAKLPLSIQVHPNDEYAKKFNSLGKNECWFVLKNKGKPFILGSTTKEIEVFKSVINTKETEEYLNKIQLQEGDFVFIEAGLIHGIPENTMVYELQQSSDITYRLYDYDRKDALGNKREIHVKESLDTMKLDIKPEIQKRLNDKGFYNTKQFNLTKIELNGNYQKINTSMAKHCLEVVVFEGEGLIDKKHSIKKGDVFIVSKNTKEIEISGNIKLFLNYL